MMGFAMLERDTVTWIESGGVSGGEPGDGEVG